MAIPRGYRFPIEFDSAFPQGLVLVGEIAPDNEYQTREDKAAGRPVLIFDNLSRPGVDRNLAWLRRTHGSRFPCRVRCREVQSGRIDRGSAARGPGEPRGSSAFTGARARS